LRHKYVSKTEDITKYKFLKNVLQLWKLNPKKSWNVDGLVLINTV